VTNRLHGVGAPKRAYALDGGRSLDAALGVIRQAWCGTAASLEGRLIEGMALFMQRHGHKDLDLAGYVHRLARIRPADIIGNARSLASMERQSVARAMAQDFLRIYNVKRKTRALAAK
jgi:hypothetical protein